MEFYLFIHVRRDSTISNGIDSGWCNNIRMRLLNGNIDQVGNDLRQINEIGVNQAILNYNRSSMSNDIDGIIDASKRLWIFIR